MGLLVKNPPANSGDKKDGSLITGRKDPLEKEVATPGVFLPGRFHGQRNLVGYRPWGHKESDTTEQLSTYTLQVILKYFLMQTSQQSERTASYRIISILPIQALILL